MNIVSKSKPLHVPASAELSKTGLSIAGYARVLLIGTFFGLVMTKSEVVRWQRIHDMFLFREPRMYLIIGIAVIVAGISMVLINRFQIRDCSGKPIVYIPKPFQWGILFGGAIFGAGWAITGTCPGPIYAQLGAGEWKAAVTFVGAMIGMYLYAWLRPRLLH